MELTLAFNLILTLSLLIGQNQQHIHGLAELEA